MDQELHKFKMELEADNSGITEILERRSLEMDAPAASTGTAKENRLPKKQVHVMYEQDVYTVQVFLKPYQKLISV